jgi:hypothetical protein
MAARESSHRRKCCGGQVVHRAKSIKQRVGRAERLPFEGLRVKRLKVEEIKV